MDENQNGNGPVFIPVFTSGDNPLIQKNGDGAESAKDEASQQNRVDRGPRKVQGLWDCPYCGYKGIGGLLKKCPHCGHPQDVGTKFYMPSEITYLDDETAAKYGKGADWDCPYCGSMNKVDAKYCVGCGAPRSVSESDYFTRGTGAAPGTVSAEESEKLKKEQQAKEEAERLRAQRQAAQEEARQKSKKRLPVVLGIAAVLLALLIFAVMPKSGKAELVAKQWERAVYVEELVNVKEADWSVPQGGVVYDQREEIHHYDPVLDHYETVAVQRSRQVQDGYDYYTTYQDNGDGTFSEIEHSTPRYTTEYYTDYEQQPVYIQVPVVYTKYYYTIDRWVQSRSTKSSGTTEEPFYNEPELASNERESGRAGVYRIAVETDKNRQYTAAVDEVLFNSLKVGKSYEIVTSGGALQEIDGHSVK